MAIDDLFTSAQKSNVPELSVSELANGIRATLEQSFGRVRVRGELSGLKLASSGHLYGDLKDDEAVINLICWKSSLPRLSVKPADGMDVVVTGRVSSYPKSSRYQMIIDTLELAGQGALLKMLEDRRKKLAAEGLFDARRKKPLPFLPGLIGVVTSPTGAVIRDIMHRLDDRFPCPVILWPVAVQGTSAAEQVAAAIRGFNALPRPRQPDLIIVARGGGSLEDLMPFNEENVVRAVADSHIPVISAVGHETDTTLIDYAADVRAPTPTAAAEMAVPRRDELWAMLQDCTLRAGTALRRKFSELRQVFKTAQARLGDPSRFLEVKTQRLDVAAAKLRNPREKLAALAERLTFRAETLMKHKDRILEPLTLRLTQLAALLESYSFHRILDRGFAVVRDESGRVLSRAGQISPGQGLEIEFAGAEKIGAVAGKPLKPKA
jgi:exodeoxyribonuclease VII large subunit